MIYECKACELGLPHGHGAERFSLPRPIWNGDIVLRDQQELVYVEVAGSVTIDAGVRTSVSDCYVHL